ncbi:MAG: hypothetical protein U9Q84_05230 [Thermodesulfobacteriota bacterium]|nr:hypothetical protein [Thermodesulfobacteriota bacterium]
MLEYLEIKRLLKRAEVVSHNHGRMVFKLDITTVKKGSINVDQMARHFREIEGIQDLSFDPKENEIELDYDTQKIAPDLLESLVEAGKKETERDNKEATLNDYKIREIPSSPEEIEAIRYENPALAEKIELVHQLRFILTLYKIRESGINVSPLKGILKKLGMEEHGDILSSQGIVSLGQGLLNRFLSEAFD